MDGFQRGSGKGLRIAHLAQLAALQLGQHMVGAGGHFVAGHECAPKHLKLALVQGVVGVVEGDHGLAD